MKRIFTLALSAMLLGASSVFAQEEDVTNYIANPGFDEDLTFQPDGSWKEIINKDKSLSDRSQAWFAADSTVYAHTKTTSGQSRPDGRKDEAVNGFFGQIKGWTAGDASYTGKSYYPYGNDAPEWVYFGAIPYDLSPQAIPIADDGTTYLEVPSKPAADNGDDNKAFIYLRAGWGGAATYKQTVKLPCAQYRLEYWAININSGASNGENLSRVVCRKDEFKDETGFNDTEWTLHTIEFTPTAEFSMEFGFKSSGGSGSNPFLCIDGIKLYKIGEADVEELLRADINDEVEVLEELQGDDLIANYPGLSEDISDMILSAEDASTEEELTAKLQELKDFRARVEALKPTIEAYEALALTAEQIKDTENPYPGFDNFEKSVDDIAAAISEAKVDEFAGYVEQMQKAIKDYFMSQEATLDNPADYTFLVATPYFTKTAANPTIVFNEDGTILSVSYPNEADYTVGSAPEDGSNEGWYIAGTTDGDQRLNYTQGRVCWNAWRTNSQDVAVAQDLVDLPNGFYTVSAEMVTQPDYVSNQHVFAKSKLQDGISPSLTEGNWDSGMDNPWTYLTTEKVLVHDGKLTIGASGSALDGSTNQTGWFCVTNFRLMYYGPATDADIANAINAKFVNAEEKANALHLAGDKVTVLEAIAAAKAINDLDSLDAAIAIADASEKEYEGVITGSYRDLQENIEGAYSANAQALAKVPVQYTTDYLGSATATYTETPAITAILRYYRDTLIPALENAEIKKEEATSEKSKAVIDGTIASVISKLTKYTDDTDFLAEQVDALNEAIRVADVADIQIAAGADVTAFIKNPTIDDSNAKGWTIKKIVGDGSGAKSGQQFDGGNGYYIDTYNSAGGLRATYYQVLSVPNGTYTVKNIMRAPGKGAYLFLSDKEPIITGEGETEALTLDPTATTKLAEAVNVTTNLTQYIDHSLQAEAGGDSISTAADAYGELWVNAINTLIADGVAIEPAKTIDGALYPIQDQIEDLKADSFVPTEEQEVLIGIVEANNGIGRGWFNNTVTSFEVKNNILVIGVTCDYAFLNKTEEEAYTGLWFSADNFTLTIDAVNDTEWDPTTGIATLNENAPADHAIYNIAGQRVDSSYKGIVIKNGQKVLVK